MSSVESQRSLKGEKESQESQRRSSKEGDRGWSDVIVSSGDERKGNKPRNAGSLWKLEKAKKESFLESPERIQPRLHLDFSPV